MIRTAGCDYLTARASAAVNDNLLTHLEAKLPQALDLLDRMVGINSFTANPAGVDELGALTAQAFARLGFRADPVPSVDPRFGSHVFLHRPGTTKRRFVLVTHLDTVYPAEEEARHDFRWQPAPAEGRIYGPGTVDIKGGTAVIWLMLHGLADLFPEFFAGSEWLIAANASEETLSADFAARTIERCPGDADAVLVFEGGHVRDREMTLVTARKGKADFRISINGRAAHSGSYHAEGRNAIVALADCVQRAAAITDYARELTVNVGLAHGGTVVNRVPHEAMAELEMRAFDDAVFAGAKARLEALAGQSPAVPDATIAVENIGETAPWPGDERTAQLFRTFASAAASLGYSTKGERRGGLSDANYLHPLGPTLDGLGPSGGNAHCSERSPDGTKVPEFVEIDSLVSKAALSILALTSMRPAQRGRNEN